MKKFIFIEEDIQYTSKVLERILTQGRYSLVYFGKLCSKEATKDELLSKGIYQHLEDVIERESTTEECTPDKEHKINVGTVGHCDYGVDYLSKECLGNFKKVTKGNRHTYPHWFKGKY